MGDLEKVSVGDWAIDCENPDSNRVLVTEVTTIPIDEYVIFETPPADADRTVAHSNPGYIDPEAETQEVTVVGVYHDDDIDIDWTPESVVSLYENGELEEIVRTIYKFPQSRLEKCESK